MFSKTGFYDRTTVVFTQRRTSAAAAAAVISYLMVGWMGYGSTTSSMKHGHDYFQEHLTQSGCNKKKHKKTKNPQIR